MHSLPDRAQKHKHSPAEESEALAALAPPGKRSWFADTASILAENERLCSFDIQRRAIQDGKAELAKRRAEDRTVGLSPHLPEPIAEVIPGAFEGMPDPPEYDDNLFTYGNLAAAALRLNLAHVHLAFDLIKRYSRTHDGREHLTTSEFVALLAEVGIGHRRALRYLKQGEGVGWDFVGHGKRDGRVKWYRVRSQGRLAAALGVHHPGRAYKLPLEAYQGNVGVYAAHVAGAWMLAHPEASRAAQSVALGRTERQLREMQASVNVRQQTRAVEAQVPRNEAESLELAPHLWSREDDAPKHHWRGPGGVYRWQDTNYYSGGLAVDLGLKRSGYINAQKDRISEDRVNEGTRASERPAVTCDPVECPKRFDDAAKADKFQARHRNRQAKIHVGRMPRAHPRHSATDREHNIDGFQLSYSYRAQFEGRYEPEIG